MPGGWNLLRAGLAWLAAAEPARKAAQRPLVFQEVLRRFVAGPDGSAGLDVAAVLLGKGRLVSLAMLTPSPAGPEEVADRIAGYHALLAEIAARGLTGTGGLAGPGGLDLTLAVSRLGFDDAVAAAPQSRDWRAVLGRARSICQAATNAGTTVTVEAEALAWAEATHLIVDDLRQDFPDVGVCVPAAWRRTEGDAVDLAHRGGRVRLVRGATIPEAGYLAGRGEIDRAYVRVMRILLEGQSRPGLFTHDPRILAIAEALAVRLGRSGRTGHGMEYVMRYGVRTETQIVIADRGDRMRVLVPFGPDWYPYVVQRLADQPRQLVDLIRAAAAR